MSAKKQYLRTFNSMQMQLLIKTNTWNHFTVCKQLVNI